MAATLLIRPRLTDYHGIHAAQVDLDFAIPFLDEDIPLYLDPFMLWRSPSQQDHGLHTGLGRVDKRDSPGAVIVIQAGICNGDQR
ncbi:hypothetical protein, partial [Ruixingdingia sedimenti]